MKLAYGKALVSYRMSLYAGEIGRTEIRHDVVSKTAIRGLQALLPERSRASDLCEAPLLSHWLHFLDIVPTAGLGMDGHPRPGCFLPVVGLPRRMWAGSQIVFERPLLVGTEVHRQSTIADIVEKRGRSGRLIFVTVDHEIGDRQGGLIKETQQIVYREAVDANRVPLPAESSTRTADAQWRREVNPDPVLLFRYSALTFNGHRIHYDRNYAEQVEGYAGLVVQGPLLATLALHEFLTNEPGKIVESFSFQVLHPVFDIASFFLCGSQADEHSAHLFITDQQGRHCLDARVTFR